ncbi:MAG: A/G-specific adenine glycosylase [Flavobacteriales bacterium]|nr:A/G-specific adenine glycosylase [Flavobacteriales bacterium]MCW8911963.1 A/G-specific adenine glycosylase [Flavobacteriales bacterium]MCW8937089.1 A/G-specific adenine glycosylase [Flavobacteriales bacterium]MCW8968818.1 A/G-specific adenine glycosylase [Flavobacteriales bacterium]MCW8989994.1 A/G-specific adenine glycosylase [Flavobacteriales bacterium]
MEFSQKLISWYKNNKRDLPWRNTINPYKIWLSEIILQQTRVNQGLSYYYKFIEHYPSVKDLANASEQEVLKLWQGLGYYSRARNLHATARIITENYDGIFPVDYKKILSLKGVGEYTAAAITSFAYNQPYPVVDGNVFRVLARIYGVDTPIDTPEGKKTFNGLANKLIDKKQAATYNQAIMEFGALVCTPKNPECENCIFNNICAALINQQIELLPLKSKKIKQTNRYFNYLIIETNNSETFIAERKNSDIWKGLYDFPLIETPKKIYSFNELSTYSNFQQIISKTAKIVLKKVSDETKHILTHQKIYATFWHISTDKTKSLEAKYKKINNSSINNYPLPKLIENYVKSF